MKKNKMFRGHWELVEWVVELADGRALHPFGTDAVGRIGYDKKGFMSVQMMKRNRVPFVSDDPFQATPEEMVAAIQGFMSYCGKYEVDWANRKVHHYLEISSIPNWTGQDLVRNFKFEEDRLILSTEFEGGIRNVLTWKKIQS